MANFDHIYRINEVLNVIHRDITADLSARKLATTAAYSEQHFHRLFKQVTGESVHQYIRRTRLELAANQLMFAPKRSIRLIAETCGFVSLSSFTRAFKSVYKVTPGKWRSGNESHNRNYYRSDPEINSAYLRIKPLPLPAPEIITLTPRKVAYLRHIGYDRSIRSAWQTMRAWAESEHRSFDHQIGLHHSNPAWVPLKECRYVACVGIDKPIIRRGRVNSMTIPGGLHAAFKLEGKYGELLPYISKIVEEWLPKSGFRAQTTPAFAIYKRNHFLAENEIFALTFYLPIAML